MTTPGEALRDAVARHVASRDAMAAVAAEIEQERAVEAAQAVAGPEAGPAPASVPTPGG